MAWLRAVNGPVNLDRVVRIVCQTNGDAFLYLDSVNYVAVSLGSTQADAIEAANRLTQAADPADY